MRRMGLFLSTIAMIVLLNSDSIKRNYSVGGNEIKRYRSGPYEVFENDTLRVYVDSLADIYRVRNKISEDTIGNDMDGEMATEVYVNGKLYTRKDCCVTNPKMFVDANRDMQKAVKMVRESEYGDK